MKRVFVLMLSLATLLVSCGSNGEKSNSKAEKASVAKVDDGVVNVFSFHAKKRCITCNTIEKLTREVVSELNNSKIKLHVIDISDKINQNIVDKYEVTWSSLVLDNGSGVNNLTNMAFSTAKATPDTFKKNLKESINKMLK